MSARIPRMRGGVFACVVPGVPVDCRSELWMDGALMSEGKFIVFEGIDGSGTTTQSRFAAEWLRSEGLDVVETFEPTDRAVGRLIRLALSRQLPGREGEEVEAELFALLFAADRLDHMKGVIVPALERGRWVVSDRCYLSSFAYQSVGCELDWVRALNRHVRRADLTVLLDLGAQTAYQRFSVERKDHDVFETVEKMAAIRASYLRVADILEREGEQIVRIDASQAIDVVAAEVRDALAGLL